MASKRFLMVPVDSSAARMPLPGAVMACATLFSSARFIAMSPWIMKSGVCSCSISAPERFRLGSFYLQHLDPWQRLALHPFQEGAAGCGHVGQAVRHARGIQCRNGV